MTEFTHYIGAAQVNGTPRRFADVYNPPPGELPAQLPRASAAPTPPPVDNATTHQPD